MTAVAGGPGQQAKHCVHAWPVANMCLLLWVLRHAVVMLCSRLSDTVRISQSIKAAIAQKSALPFELKVLEALLAGEQRCWAGRLPSVRWGCKTVARPACTAEVQRVAQFWAGRAVRL